MKRSALPFVCGRCGRAFLSIVVAVKAIVLNLLSVAAAYGVLALVPARRRQGPARFQLHRGHLAGRAGIRETFDRVGDFAADRCANKTHPMSSVRPVPTS